MDFDIPVPLSAIVANDAKSRVGGKVKKKSPKLMPYSARITDKSISPPVPIISDFNNDLGEDFLKLNGSANPVSAGVVTCCPAEAGLGAVFCSGFTWPFGLCFIPSFYWDRCRSLTFYFSDK